MPTISNSRTTSAEQRLKALGIELPPPPQPFGTYVEAVQAGNLLYLSGMLPTEGHRAKFVGRVGAELDVDTGREAARLASLNALAVARQHLGSLDRVTRVVKLGVSVATSGDVREQPKIADAASDLLRDVFGEEKSPARSVYGVASLPLGTPVELEIIFEVAGKEKRGESSMQYPTSYRTTEIDGHSIFYREAGPSDAPTLLLLHGLPSSSRMFEPLFARLSDRYHLLAPDYPGFGHSDWPSPKEFAYTFDHYAEIMNHFTESLGLSRFTLYMQDYGGPVGFRMVLLHPEPIVPPTRARSAQTSSHWRRREHDMSGMIPTSNATIRISGPMSLPFSIRPVRPTFRATCSTTTARTSSPIQRGSTGCARSSRACSSYGANMISRSSYRSRTLIAKMYQPQKSTCSMRVTSRSTRVPIESRSSLGSSCASRGMEHESNPAFSHRDSRRHHWGRDAYLIREQIHVALDRLPS